MTLTNILFKAENDHNYRIREIDYDFSVTMPVHQIRASYETPYEYDYWNIDDITKADSDHKLKNKHKNFYEILDTMLSMNNLYVQLHLYMRGNRDNGSTPNEDLKDEVKAVHIMKNWLVYANILHELVGYTTELKLTKRLILKIGRETFPTLFSMPNNEIHYDDSKSVIVCISPYEDNTQALKEKKVSKDCEYIENKLEEFLKEASKIE